MSLLSQSIFSTAVSRQGSQEKPRSISTPPPQLAGAAGCCMHCLVLGAERFRIAKQVQVGEEGCSCTCNRVFATLGLSCEHPDQLHASGPKCAGKCPRECSRKGGCPSECPMGGLRGSGVSKKSETPHGTLHRAPPLFGELLHML